MDSNSDYWDAISPPSLELDRDREETNGPNSNIVLSGRLDGEQEASRVGDTIRDWAPVTRMSVGVVKSRDGDTIRDWVPVTRMSVGVVKSSLVISPSR